MTVKELIERLSVWPGYFKVLTEGCDCVGDIHDVELFNDADSTDTVWLTRPAKRKRND